MSQNTVPQKMVGEAERFWAKVNKDAPGGCWEWTGCKQDAGYGRFRVGPKMVRSHRWSYEQVNGRIPEGKQIDHLCRNPACVNPSHLDAVTAQENVRRAWERTPSRVYPNGHPGRAQPRLSHCKRGHEFTPENTYTFVTSKDGREHRACRTCHKMAQDRRRGKS